jgi:transposase
MFIDGEVITEQTILPKIHGKFKATAAELVEAMDGKLSFEDRFLLGQSLEHYRHSVNQVEEITVVIKQYVLERFEREYNLLIELPGVSAIVACVILSEIGPNVEAFKSQGNLASWAGVCPGSYESAGIKKSQVTNDCAMWIGCFEFTVQRIPQIRFIALRLMDPIVGYRVTGL